MTNFLTDEDRANIAEFQKVYESMPTINVAWAQEHERKHAVLRDAHERMQTFPAYPRLTTDEYIHLLRSMSYPEVENAPHFDSVTHFGGNEDYSTNPVSFREAQVLSLAGEVTVRHARVWPRKEITYTFASLSRFAQGYVHALLSDLLFMQREVPLVRFGQIDPRTLARIIKDCAAAEDAYPDDEGGLPETKGCIFWIDRLNEELGSSYLSKTFRPLIPYLTNKGRVIFNLPLKG